MPDHFQYYYYMVHRTISIFSVPAKWAPNVCASKSNGVCNRLFANTHINKILVINGKYVI